MSEEAIEDTLAEDKPDEGNTAPTVPTANTNVPTENPEQTKTAILDVAPTILRKDTEKVSVDDDFNLAYALKNGKQLKVSVMKPNLSISTRLSDEQIKISESDNGERSMMINNVGVYGMIMSSIIRVVLVDGAPLHSITFESLSTIGMTKSELDDLMGIIVTFYLSE